MLAIQPTELDQLTVLASLTVEGTTNSPTDYESLSSDDYTASNLDDSYYSTFSYPLQNSSSVKYLMINISEAGLSSNAVIV